jgi:biotin operon repressor
MKSQDIVVLLKLISLHQRLQGVSQLRVEERSAENLDWQGWEASATEEALDPLPGNILAEAFSVRGLEASLGISKSEVNASIQRSYQTGLAIQDRKSGYPKANVRSLLEFIAHGLKYVFPAKPGAMVRGIPTAAAAPVLQGELVSASDYICVWPDAQGCDMGQTLDPLFRSVPHAVRRDPELYATLALVDAIRLGNPRESKLARQLLEKRLNA